MRICAVVAIALLVFAAAAFVGPARPGAARTGPDAGAMSLIPPRNCFEGHYCLRFTQGGVCRYPPTYCSECDDTHCIPNCQHESNGDPQWVNADEDNPGYCYYLDSVPICYTRYDCLFDPEMCPWYYGCIKGDWTVRISYEHWMRDADPAQCTGPGYVRPPPP